MSEPTLLDGLCPAAPPESETTSECLGLDFPSPEERRNFFRARLGTGVHEADREVAMGRPSGSDADIARLSDPPYFTAAPNPFLADWVEEVGHCSDACENYSRTPFPIDSREGKSDPLYAAHGYHTKVPPRAIVQSIVHFTRPGDLVLDPFAGSGMTGVAAQLCETADRSLRASVGKAFQAAGLGEPDWGLRRAILNDLSPAAAFISANYNIPVDVSDLEVAGKRLLRELWDEVGWMYRTLHSDGKSVGRIRYVVWSQIFACPVCSADVPFLECAMDSETDRVRKSFPCQACGAALRKPDLRRILDPVTSSAGEERLRLRMEPCLISYSVDGSRYEKEPDDADLLLLERIAALPLPPAVPTNPFPIETMYHGSRLAPNGVLRVHHLYLPRAAHALGRLWGKAARVPDTRMRNMLLFIVEQAIGGMSLLNRYSPRHFSHVNQVLGGVYYLPSQHAECSPWYILDAKLGRVASAFAGFPACRDAAIVTTGSAASLGLPSESVDYIFTDPPFGENIPYADLNFVVESWHRVWTCKEDEAIVHRPTGKGLEEYRSLMGKCFEEAYRVLKPGRWMTVVFHNSQNRVWNAIQEALLSAGFVVAGVRGLDKRQGSYRQVTSSAVRQDLVICAYKPGGLATTRLLRQPGTEESVWTFIRHHLQQLPRFNSRNGNAELVTERGADMLYDAMISFHLRRGVEIPLSLAEFRRGLDQRYSVRDGMYFLPEGAAEYDKQRLRSAGPQQLQLFVHDEPTAIQWIRRELSSGPKTLQALAPKYLRETQRRRQPHEAPLELANLLQDNFLPTADGWTLPDAGRSEDLERIRERSLLREFSRYLPPHSSRKSGYRLEALRAGFRRAWRDRDYTTIVRVARRLPPTLLEEDATLLMWYEQARLRSGIQP
ncbi:MAG TPA: DNA methyltransferase [Longimicrobiaceae bacterium]|nr:DNA methyltransferase [Longimicrobiaceae bacterium]